MSGGEDTADSPVLPGVDTGRDEPLDTGTGEHWTLAICADSSSETARLHLARCLL